MELTQEQVTEIIADTMRSGQISVIEKAIVEAVMQTERSEYNAQTGDVSNGYRSRQIVSKGNTLVLQVPRTRRRGFMPAILGVIKNRHRELEELTRVMVSRGSTYEDVAAVMEVFYGQTYSTSQISRLAMASKEKIEKWLQRRLPKEAEALMIDATYIKTKRDDVKTEAYLIAMALYKDGTREIVGVYNNPTEGSGLWEELFLDLQERGLKKVGLIISDGLSGIETAAEKLYPNVDVQLCTVHMERELSYKPRREDKSELMSDFKEVFRPGKYETPEEGREAFLQVCQKWEKKYRLYRKYKDSPRLIYYFTYLKYSSYQQRYIHSTNWVERFNRNIKKATHSKCQMPSPEEGVYLIGLVAWEATYLKYRITDLIGGLRKKVVVR
jgi:putative transposase